MIAPQRCQIPVARETSITAASAKTNKSKMPTAVPRGWRRPKPAPKPSIDARARAQKVHSAATHAAAPAAMTTAPPRRGQEEQGSCHPVSAHAFTRQSSMPNSLSSPTAVLMAAAEATHIQEINNANDVQSSQAHAGTRAREHDIFASSTQIPASSADEHQRGETNTPTPPSSPVPRCFWCHRTNVPVGLRRFAEMSDTCSSSSSSSSSDTSGSIKRSGETSRQWHPLCADCEESHYDEADALRREMKFVRPEARIARKAKDSKGNDHAVTNNEGQVVDGSKVVDEAGELAAAVDTLLGISRQGATQEDVESRSGHHDISVPAPSNDVKIRLRAAAQEQGDHVAAVTRSGRWSSEKNGSFLGISQPRAYGPAAAFGMNRSVEGIGSSSPAVSSSGVRIGTDAIITPPKALRGELDPAFDCVSPSSGIMGVGNIPGSVYSTNLSLHRQYTLQHDISEPLDCVVSGMTGSMPGGTLQTTHSTSVLVNTSFHARRNITSSSTPSTSSKAKSSPLETSDDMPSIEPTLVSSTAVASPLAISSAQKKNNISDDSSSLVLAKEISSKENTGPCKTTVIAVNIAIQLTETHSGLEDLLNGNKEADTVDTGRNEAVDEGNCCQIGLLDYIRRGLLQNTVLSSRFCRYYREMKNVDDCACTDANEAASLFSTEHRFRGGAVKIVEAARKFEREMHCLSQHNDGTNDARSASDSLQSLLTLVKTEADHQLKDITVIEMTLAVLSAKHSGKFDDGEAQRIRKRLEYIKSAVVTARKQGGEEGCQLGEVARDEIRLARGPMVGLHVGASVTVKRKRAKSKKKRQANAMSKGGSVVRVRLFSGKSKRLLLTESGPLTALLTWTDRPNADKAVSVDDENCDSKSILVSIANKSHLLSSKTLRPLVASVPKDEWSSNGALVIPDMKAIKVSIRDKSRLLSSATRPLLATIPTRGGLDNKRRKISPSPGSSLSLVEQQHSFSSPKKYKGTVEKASKAFGASLGSPNSPRAVYNRSAPEIGAGWTTVGVRRAGGATKGHIDKYWYSPKQKKRFRSMKEVQRFLDVLDSMANGDEDAAYSMIFASI